MAVTDTTNSAITFVCGMAAGVILLAVVLACLELWDQHKKWQRIAREAEQKRSKDDMDRFHGRPVGKQIPPPRGDL